MSNKPKKDKTSHHFRKWLKASGRVWAPELHREAHGCFGCYVGLLYDCEEYEHVRPSGAVWSDWHGMPDNRKGRRWGMNAQKLRKKGK